MHRWNLLIALTGVLASTSAGAYNVCGPLKDGYGPFDYRTSAKQLAIVEGAHFTDDVETLRRGNTRVDAGGDIDYTLRSSPNHHRALIAMVNLGFKLKTNKPPGARYTIPCYFDRAIRFAPDDGQVYAIYGIFLARAGKPQEALKQLKTAESLAKDDPNVEYNLGLVYFSLKDYPNARTHAQRAYELGSALPGLKTELQAIGQWQEPAAATAKEQPAEPAATPRPASE